MSYSSNALFNSNAWPHLEAKKIYEKIKGKVPAKGYVLFETGYGPSGLPHIGTFGEVARTTMVRNAFISMYPEIPTKLICFSDDMDGLRKVPSNVPQREMLEKCIDLPLTSIPDPFGEAESYGHYMNRKLRSFLDKFGFEYEFYSATESYRNGLFDSMLIHALEKYDEIMALMLPTFREERKATYSPFMPLCKKTGKVLQVPIDKVDLAAKTISFYDLDGEYVTTEVTGGKCKLQWKPDFGMRWAGLDVDYEMYGKDHMPNAEIYSQICRILGGTPPVQFFYELFLNEEGQKISKSKGNSLTIDEWLQYAPLESMALFMFQSPSKAKRLYFDVIPKNVDEYLTFNKKFHEEQDEVKKLANPAYHIHNGNVPVLEMYGLSFALLLNLASVCNPEHEDVMWGFISKYAPNSNAQSAPYLAQLVKFSVAYYNDFIKPQKKYLSPSAQHVEILKAILARLSSMDESLSSEEIQSAIYAIGKEYGYEDLREYFKTLYQILLGSEEGPRLGSFIKLFGLDKTKKLISDIIERAAA